MQLKTESQEQAIKLNSLAKSEVTNQILSCST